MLSIPQFIQTCYINLEWFRSSQEGIEGRIRVVIVTRCGSILLTRNLIDNEPNHELVWLMQSSVFLDGYFLPNFKNLGFTLKNHGVIVSYISN